MPLVPAKCTQCGGNLEVDATQEAAICPHCKTPFVTEKAINNYNTTNITNIDTINAEVVNVESSDSAANLARTADTLVGFGEWNKAREIFIKITRMYPYDYRGWYGLLQTNTHNFQMYFECYEEYNTLVSIYKRLEAVADKNSPILLPVKEYLRVVREKVYQNLERDIVVASEQIVKDVPCELKEEKAFGIKATKVILYAWVVVASLIALSQGIKILVSEYDLDLDITFGFVRFLNMDSFWDVILFTSVLLLMLQMLVSLVLCIIGLINLSAQKRGKYKRKTAFEFVTKFSIIATATHLVYWLVTITIVGMNDSGYFFTYTGTYRYIETLLFNTKATETDACWIALLLIIIYSVLNYMLVAAPLFVAERIGEQKHNAILLNIQHKQEVARLLEKKNSL